ncbi:MAG: glycosyltransferase family 87 protein [Pseudomonadota bacterium]
MTVHHLQSHSLSMVFRNWIVLPLVLLHVAITAHILLPLLSSPGTFGTPGTNDFIEYWSAYRIASDEMNPYEPVNQRERQQGLGRPGEPMMMWNPPWIFSLMGPVLRFPFHEASQLWLVVSLTLYVSALVLVLSMYRRSGVATSVLVLLGFTSFIPMSELLRVGQVGALFASAIALSMFASSKNRHILAGVPLAVLTLKPHLFYLVFVYAILWSLRQRTANLGFGFVIGVAILVAPVCAASPELLLWWFDALSTTQQTQGATDVRSWVGTSLAGILRALSDGTPLSALAYQTRWLIPLTTTAATWFFFIRRRSCPAPHEWLPIVVVVSLLTSPFGWIFDQVAAAPGLLAMLLTSKDPAAGPAAPATVDGVDRAAVTLSAIAAAINLLTFLSIGTLIRYHHEFFPYLPLWILLIVWYRRSAQGAAKG